MEHMVCAQIFFSQKYGTCVGYIEAKRDRERRVNADMKMSNRHIYP